MALNMKPSCPKCGSKDISKITTGLSLGKGYESKKAGKQWPEPYNDEPPEYRLPPMMDFNHTHHCNSCGHSFGGSWGRVL